MTLTQTKKTYPHYQADEVHLNPSTETLVSEAMAIARPLNVRHESDAVTLYPFVWRPLMPLLHRSSSFILTLQSPEIHLKHPKSATIVCHHNAIAMKAESAFSVGPTPQTDNTKWCTGRPESSLMTTRPPLMRPPTCGKTMVADGGGCISVDGAGWGTQHFTCSFYGHHLPSIPRSWALLPPPPT